MATRKLEVLFIGDTSSLDKAFAKSEKGAGKLGKGFAVAGKAGAAGIAGIAAAAVAASPKLIDLASDAEETASKFKVVFGREAKNATKALDEFSKATGTSKFALREQAAGLQALIRPMGVNTKNAAGMSVELTKLATDLASFNNSSVQEAITALQSGLVGESEPLRRFGVQLSAARIETFAYAEGIAKQGKDLTAAQKAQAAYGIILKDTTLAQGDAVRTSDSFANQWKRLQSQLTDVATALGTTLLPTVTKVVSAVTGFVSKLQSGSGDAGRFGEVVRAAWERVQAAVSSAVEFVRGVLNQHRDDVENVGEAVRNLAVAAAFVWEQTILPIIKRVLPAIKQIVKGTFDVIGGIIKTVASLLTGDFRGAWEGVKQIFKGALGAILGQMRLMTAPLREIATQIGQGIAKAFDSAWEKVKAAVRAVIDWLKDRASDVKDAAEKLASPFVSAFGKMTDAVKGLLDMAGKVVGAIKSVIEWIGRIKIPSIKIPGIGGRGGGNVGPGKMPAGVDGFNDDAARFGNVVTSGFRPGDPGWHGQNRARDYAGGNMLGFAQYMAANFGSRLLELIHTPLGFGIKNGRKVPLAFWGAATNADHYDHVHVALAGGGHLRRGGWAVVGEKGPELARLPTGSTVFSNAQSRDFIGGPLQPASARLINRGRNPPAFLPGTGIKGVRADLRPAVITGEDPNKALIDAINELAALERQRIDLTNTQLADARRSLNVSQSQYQVLAKAIADVANGQIGQRLGLGLSGLRAAPGSVARI